MPEGVDLPNSVIRTPNRAFACGLHCVPRGDGVLYLGATNIISERPKQQALISDVQFLLDCAVDQLNLDLHDAEIISIQVGNRPIPADGFPLIGECCIKGLWLATGTYRDGLHQSPLLARYIADCLADVETFGLDLSAFKPCSRSIIWICPRAYSQRNGTADVCHWIRVSLGLKALLVSSLDEGLSRNYEQLINNLHPSFTPPPELVAFGYLYESILKRLSHYYEEWS